MLPAVWPERLTALAEEAFVRLPRLRQSPSIWLRASSAAPWAYRRNSRLWRGGLHQVCQSAIGGDEVLASDALDVRWCDLVHVVDRGEELTPVAIGHVIAGEQLREARIVGKAPDGTRPALCLGSRQGRRIREPAGEAVEQVGDCGFVLFHRVPG